MAFNWTCPHCNVPQTVTDKRHDVRFNYISLVNQAEGDLALEQTAIGCANPDCLKTSVKVRIGGRDNSSGTLRLNNRHVLFSQMVIPQGTAKPQPDFIPAPLREDYYEACLIRDFSPKASATLIRRCLQGMIRDFAKIAKGTLAKEIEALRQAVEDGSADRAISGESVEAIDQVRGIGNIGAHMEKEIDLIIEVDPGEAQALIELVEMLFEEWYGARHRRQQRLEHIAAIADAKKEAKKAAATGAAPSTAKPAIDTLIEGGPALQVAIEESLHPVAGGSTEDVDGHDLTSDGA
ncbi:DUF4145 domain-containing protein [Sphingomonas sp. HDW15A]|uniref:DUF4145 domain-containing protein n=1 Tax=Sphingomonas sp. HDW15A TaxID=2714942 RepID=UPI00140BE6AD|nr:DUF4145 domain-containing protein [Sphingomonas sp. HDW15A]QIK95472.1 DUF4145 domain-containing protein [Sphingomonas sp. HDW15A]